jgi:hypothetical protein
VLDGGGNEEKLTAGATVGAPGRFVDHGTLWHVAQSEMHSIIVAFCPRPDLALNDRVAPHRVKWAAMTKRALLLRIAPLFAISIACGGSTPPASAPHEHAEHEHGQEEEHHGNLPKEVREFHDLLAPLWHAEKGPERVTKTCAQARALHAAAIEAAGARDKANDASWKAEGGALVDATAALAAECDKEGRPQFEARLSDVHEHFHKLVENLSR